MDGTLLDSMPMWDRVAVEYLRRRGVVPRPDVREVVRPMSIQEVGEYFREEYGIAGACHEIVCGINDIMAEYYSSRAEAKDGAKEALEALRRKGVRMCVATATDRPLALSGLRRAGLLDYFDGIVTCTEAGAGKDRPDIYLRALKLLGTPRDSTVVFEDMLYAVRTAKRAGFTVVALYDESSARHEIELRREADMYIKSFRELEV